MAAEGMGKVDGRGGVAGREPILNSGCGCLFDVGVLLMNVWIGGLVRKEQNKYRGYRLVRV